MLGRIAWVMRWALRVLGMRRWCDLGPVMEMVPSLMRRRNRLFGKAMIARNGVYLRLSSNLDVQDVEKLLRLSY